MILRSLFILAFVVFVFSCGEKKTVHEKSVQEETDSDEWKPMDDFHTIMAEAFHPYKDSGNIQPAKENAGNLVAAANKWVSAPLPAKVDNDNVRSKLTQLQQDASKFEITVREGKDEEIGTSLNSLHDLFHELQDAWYHSDAGDNHDGHQH